MKNTIFNFKKDEIDDLLVSDYRSKKLELDIDPNDITFVNIHFNTLIETISNNYYKTPNYHDVILLINDRLALFDMPYDNDIILSMTEEFLQNYIYNPEIPYQGHLNNDFINELKDYILNKFFIKNFEFSKLKLIEKDKIFKYIH